MTLSAIAELFTQGKRQEAIQKLAEYIRDHPTEQAAYLTLGTYLTAVGDFVQGEKLYQQAMTQFGESTDFQYGLANLYYQAQNYSAALNLFQKTRQAANFVNDSTYMLSETYWQLGKQPQALAFALQAQSQTPKSVDAQLLVGRLGLQMGLFEVARQAFASADRLKPQQAATIFNLGLTYLVDGKREQAQTYFDQVQKLDAKFYQAQQKQLSEIVAFLQANHADPTNQSTK